MIFISSVDIVEPQSIKLASNNQVRCGRAEGIKAACLTAAACTLSLFRSEP